MHLATLTYQVPVDLVEAVGRAVNEVIFEKDGSAIAAVKGKTRLANATGVDPLPSSPSPDLSLVQATAPLPSTSSPEAGDTESQAKASEDNGRITGGAGPVTGEASRVDAGRTASATSERMDVTVVGDESGTLADSPEREPGNPEVCAISSKRSSSGDSRPAARGSLENAAESPAGDPIKRERKPLKPYCQRPELCGGYGKKHCGTCERAAGAQAA